MAANCISLKGSTSCPAFSSASISTDSTLVGFFPFLSSVRDTSSFDTGLQNYIGNGFSQQRYQQQIGCSNVDLSNSSDLYARYTTSVLCNAIVQNSIQPCSLTGNATEPLCADTCADYARSEQQIASTPQICGTSGSNAISEIRADFTNCALPQNSLSQSCIEGVQNEPDNCGFSNNLGGLCTYCAASSPNATDSCCLFSDSEHRCSNVELPITTSMPPLFPSGTPSATPNSSNNSQGLSGGQIAGIVVGSVLGAIALLALIIGCCLLLRRRNRSQRGSVFNQLSPSRSPAGPPGMVFRDGAPSTSPARYGIIGGRVARMSALERAGEEERQGYHDSPDSGIRQPPKRSGSLSSGSHLGAIAAAGLEDESSPQTNSNGDYSSPEGVGSGQSEQLAFFKDYYSQDEIRPGDKVAVLWAYQPRANDEFELERGDMLKVVGIWDDGWATGVRLLESAEEWEDDRHNPQRDSGMSNGSSRSRDSPTGGEIKAFPLVCVCLPRHWRKTIEGESAEDTGASGDYDRPPSL